MPSSPLPRLGLLLLLGCLGAAAAQQKPKTNKGKPETAADYYAQWLKKDVVYIITPEERSVFLKLQSDEERD